MAAKDYDIYMGMTKAYFTKKRKYDTKKQDDMRRRDKREITTEEILELFWWHLCNWNMEHPGKELVFNYKGKVLFKAKLLDSNFYGND